MSTHDNKKSDCLKDAEFAALLYGEMSDTERWPLEEHLADCSNCIDEFAIVSEARLAAYEWNRDEFAHLATPVVKINYSDSPVHAGFFDKVFAGLSVFTQFGAATAALALIAIVAFGAYLLLTPANVANVAESQSPAAPQSVVQTPAKTAASNVTETKDEAPAFTARPVPASVHIKKTQRAVQKAEVAVEKKQNIRIRPESLVAQKQSAPRLTNDAEVSDNSLRLADLFSELDANE